MKHLKCFKVSVEISLIYVNLVFGASIWFDSNRPKKPTGPSIDQPKGVKGDMNPIPMKTAVSNDKATSRKTSYVPNELRYAHTP